MKNKVVGVKFTPYSGGEPQGKTYHYKVPSHIEVKKGDVVLVSTHSENKSNLANHEVFSNFNGAQVTEVFKSESEFMMEASGNVKKPSKFIVAVLTDEVKDYILLDTEEKARQEAEKKIEKRIKQLDREQLLKNYLRVTKDEELKKLMVTAGYSVEE